MYKKLITLGLCTISLFSLAQHTESKTKSQPKFTIRPSIGYAWRTAKTASGLSQGEKDYIKGLKSGVNFDIAAFFQVNKMLSVGGKFSNYRASSNGYFVGYVSDMPVSIPVTTNDQINFYGVGFMISNDSEDTRHKMFVDVGLGVISYTTKTGYVKGTGSNLGADLNLGYQYQVTKNILIGPKLGLTGGTLSKIKMNGVSHELAEDEKEGLHRVSLSVAASLRF